MRENYCAPRTQMFGLQSKRYAEIIKMIRWTAKTEKIRNSIERSIKLSPERKNIILFAHDFNAIYNEDYHIDNKIHYRDDYYLLKFGVKYD